MTNSDIENQKLAAKRMHEFELTVRTIEDLLPDMSTPSLQKWKGIIHTIELKIDQELKNTTLHQCRICFFSEWGYRDELPSFWYKKGSAEICFKHEYKDAEKLLKDAGYEEDAFFPEEIQPVTVEGLKVHMEKNLPPPKDETEQDYDDLLAEL